MTSEGGAIDGSVPKLRFPKFRDTEPWKPGVLSDLLFEPKEKNRGLAFGVEDVLSVSGEHGCVNQIQLLGRSYAGASVKEYNVVQTGDVVYTKSPLKACPNGIIKTNKGPAGIVSVLYAVYRPKEGADPNFIDYYFSSDEKLNNYLQPLVKKGPKNSILVNNSEVLQGAFAAPLLHEQQKIAECLSSLDALITAEGERLAALKDHKTGLMQALFPAPGQTTPRFRFPEFHNAGEWQEKSLGKAVTIQSGATPSKANPAFWNGSIPWVSAKDMKQLFLDDTEDHISAAAVADGARLIPSGALLILTRGMTLLKDIPICLLSREMACNQDVKALRPRVGVNGLYLIFVLLASKRRLLEMVDIAGHGTGKLDTGELEAFKIAYPSAPEQQRIADCFLSLEELVRAACDKIASLKRHKSALMQQLFPPVAEVRT